MAPDLGRNFHSLSLSLSEVNLRPKLDIPDEVSVDFKNAVKSIVDDVIECVEQHHHTAPQSPKATATAAKDVFHRGSLSQASLQSEYAKSKQERNRNVNPVAGDNSTLLFGV